MAYYAYQKLGSYCKRQIIPYRNSHDQATAIAIAIAMTLALVIAIVAAAIAIALLRNYPYLKFRVPALGLRVAV